MVRFKLLKDRDKKLGLKRGCILLRNNARIELALVDMRLLTPLINIRHLHHISAVLHKTDILLASRPREA